MTTADTLRALAGELNGLMNARSKMATDAGNPEHAAYHEGYRDGLESVWMDLQRKADELEAGALDK